METKEIVRKFAQTHTAQLFESDTTLDFVVGWIDAVVIDRRDMIINQKKEN